MALKAQVWTELGNAYRLGGHLDRATLCLDRAIDFYAAGARDPITLASIGERLASLLYHRRRFPETLALLDRLYEFHRRRGHLQLAGKVLVKRGLYTGNAGDSALGIIFTCQGLSLIRPDHDPELHLAAVHNLLWLATNLERFELVSRLLELVRPLYGADRLNLLRLRWLEGRVAAGLNNDARSEAAFRETKLGFLAEGLVYPASVVSLDLALLWLKLDRVDDVRELAEELLRSFRALGVSREAIASLILLRRSCERSHVLVAEVRDRISKVRNVLTELDHQRA